MLGTDTQDVRTTAKVQQMIADIRASDQTSQRFKEMYIRFLVLANAGGIAACLSMAGSIAGKGQSEAIALKAAVGPLAIFLIGVMSAGLIVSLMYKAALHETEQRAMKLAGFLQEAGLIVATPKTVFMPIELKGVLIVDRAIMILGVVSPIAFVIGSIWGLMLIAYAH